MVFFNVISFFSPVFIDFGQWLDKLLNAGWAILKKASIIGMVDVRFG